jgi:hypothetical protein
MAINVQFTSGKFSARDDNDVAAIGYLVWAYQTGTTTPIPTYSDPECTVANDSPYITLDVRGEAFIYVNAATDFYLTIPTATDVSSPIWESRKVGQQQSDTWSADGVSDGYNNYAVTVTPAPTSIGES